MNRRTWTSDLLREVGRQFDLRGEFLEGGPYGTGHINDTFAVTYDQAGTRVRYVHQRLNAHVFKEPAKLMENVERVCRHTALKVRETAPPDDISRRVLNLVPAVGGMPYWVDDAGDTWRTYFFIENAATHDVITSPDQAQEAARAFGHFQAMLAVLPAEGIHETVPDFHPPRKRFETLKRAAEADTRDRVARAGPEIEFAFSREPLAGILLDLHAAGEIPARITHNDTKLNNVMLDNRTGEGICVIDLDTVMPGLSLYDFGDMVRTATSPAAEDERDLSRVHARPEMFEALARGFLASAGNFLNKTERAHLVTAGKLLTFENGIRFLTDFLSGDVYFKTQRDAHNLDRCRTQFALLRSLEAQEAAFHKIVDSVRAPAAESA